MHWLLLYRSHHKTFVLLAAMRSRTCITSWGHHVFVSFTFWYNCFMIYVCILSVPAFYALSWFLLKSQMAFDNGEWEWMWGDIFVVMVVDSWVKVWHPSQNKRKKSMPQKLICCKHCLDSLLVIYFVGPWGFFFQLGLCLIQISRIKYNHQSYAIITFKASTKRLIQTTRE